MPTINNYVGFETGGLEEADVIDGTPVIVTSPVNTGTYALSCEGDGNGIDISGELVANAGNDFIVGFAFQTDTIPPTDNSKLIEPGIISGLRHWILRLETDGTLGIYDQGGSLIATSSFSLNVDTWYYIEAYWVRDQTAGSVEIFVDGDSKVSGSSMDTDEGTDEINYQFESDTSDVGVIFFYDDFYCMSGAVSTSELLGRNTEVLGIYQNTVEDATDQGDTLDQGTWADTGSLPFTEEGTLAGYTAAGALDGHTLTDDADSNLRPGPDGDPAVDGTIQAGKWIWELLRGNGSATTHNVRFGHNGDTTTEVVTLSNSIAVFERLLEVSDSKVPTAVESFAAGFTKSAGGRDIECADLGCFLLQVGPSAGFVGISKVHPRNNILLRM